KTAIGGEQRGEQAFSNPAFCDRAFGNPSGRGNQRSDAFILLRCGLRRANWDPATAEDAPPSPSRFCANSVPDNCPKYSGLACRYAMHEGSTDYRRETNRLNPRHSNPDL